MSGLTNNISLSTGKKLILLGMYIQKTSEQIKSSDKDLIIKNLYCCKELANLSVNYSFYIFFNQLIEQISNDENYDCNKDIYFCEFQKIKELIFEDCLYMEGGLVNIDELLEK